MAARRRRKYKTRLKDAVAYVDMHRWERDDFAYLGIVCSPGVYQMAWAWLSDGRSIDRDDRGFDLIGFPKPKSGI
jgi:hypothetical protein